MTAERRAESPDAAGPIYKGYLLAPARTPGKLRVLNADASVVVPLSLRIYDNEANACRAIREYLALQSRNRTM